MMGSVYFTRLPHLLFLGSLFVLDSLGHAAVLATERAAEQELQGLTNGYTTEREIASHQTLLDMDLSPSFAENDRAENREPGIDNLGFEEQTGEQGGDNPFSEEQAPATQRHSSDRPSWLLSEAEISTVSGSAKESLQFYQRFLTLSHRHRYSVHHVLSRSTRRCCLLCVRLFTEIQADEL
ncbi:UNVERIFIED_CONTAM: hypothetical protein HHA_243378 [Hammondia hammondi]|eukprot:XP_008884357.1 hypothetical protein HHA_243378 [Hammondia hammondi]